MRAFRDYIREENEVLNSFIKNNGLETAWNAHKNTPKPIIAPPEESSQWKAPVQETIRSINNICKGIVNHSTKTNHFGIENINFELIGSQETYNGVKLTLEASGISHAKDNGHVNRQLDKLMQIAKKPLADSKIRMEILYHKLDTNDSLEEFYDEPAIGLVKKLDFRVICLAFQF